MSAPVSFPAVIVGNNPDPIPLVRGAEGARRYAIPFSVKPALGQVPENGSHPVRKERCHVLHDPVARSNHAKGSHKFPVESRTLSGKAGALPGKGNVLTREAAADDISHTFRELHRGHVSVAGYMRPMLRKHLLTKRFDLAEGYRAHSRPFKTERKSADA
jgi:hypothetical protein